MNKYIFAKLFIKLAKIGAIATFVLGVVFILFEGYVQSQKIKAMTYQATHEFEAQKKLLQTTYQDTQKKVLDSLSQSQFNSLEEIQLIDFKEKESLLSKTPESQKPEVYENLAKQLAQSSSQIKDYHKKEFDTSIKKLRDALLAYASKIKDQMGLVVSQKLPPKQYIADSNQEFRIFDDENKDHVRNVMLSNIQSRLDAIRQLSTNPENIDSASKASAHIEYLRKLMPSPVETYPESKNQVDQQEAPELKSEMIAQKLLDDQKKISMYFYDNWVLDSQIEKLHNLCNEEKTRRSSLEQSRRLAVLTCILKIGTLTLAVIFLSFILLVLADLIDAFINISTNTDIFKGYATNSEN
jgi:hypothetical protein